MIRAVMLIKSGGRVPKAARLAGELECIPSVTEAYAVFGRFDVIAFLEDKDIKGIFRSASDAAKLEGVMSSETLIEAGENQQSEDYSKGPFSS